MGRHIKCQATDCPLHGKKVVPYDGNRSGRVVFLGESPGFNEEKRRKPFVGEAGDMAKGCCREAKIAWSGMTILNSARCRILKDKMSDKEIGMVLGHCRQYVERALKVMRPKVIVAAGNIAVRQLFLGKKHKITKIRGTWMWNDEFNCWVMPTFHPAYILRNRALKPLLVSDLKMVRAFIANKYKMPESIIDGFDYKETNSIRDILDAGKVVAIDTEGQGLEWVNPSYVCISFSVSNAEGVARDVVLYEECDAKNADFSFEWKRVPKGKKKPVPTTVYVRRAAHFARKLEELRELCEREDIKKVTMNGNFDKHVLRTIFAAEGVRVEFAGFVMDIQAAANLIDETMFKQSNLTTLQRAFANYTEDYNREFEQKYGKADMLAVPREERTKYACGDADVTRQAALGIAKELTKPQHRRLWNYHKKFTIPALNFLFTLEENGAYIDQQRLPEVTDRIEFLMRAAQKQALIQVPKRVFKMKKHVDKNAAKMKKDKILLTRDDLVRDIIFSKRGFSLKPIKYTKTKAPSVDKEVRTLLLDQALLPRVREFIAQFNLFSEYHTLWSRYLRGFERHIKPWTQMIHSSMSLVTTVTGRVACMPLNAEILTVNGWKCRGELNVGDKVIGFDVQNGSLRITEVESIHDGKDKVGKLVYKHGKTRNIGVECTKNHRWVVSNGRIRGFMPACCARKEGVGGPFGFGLVLEPETDALDSFPTEKLYDQHEAAIVGWVLTDGHIDTTSAGNYYAWIKLVKKKSISALSKVLAGIPHSRSEKGVHTVFGLRVAEFDPIWKRFKSFGNPMQYLLALSPNARKYMWDAMMEADGSIRNYGGGGAYYRFGNADIPGPNKPDVGDIFSALSVLLGRSLYYRNRSAKGRKPFTDWELSNNRKKIPSYVPPAETDREIDVWCPQTGTGTWIVRQNGVIGITGNSSNPNMMNNPKRSRAAHEIRRLIAAPRGYLLLAADESQAELRWAAHLSGDPEMIRIFKDDSTDIHTETAMDLTGKAKWGTLDKAGIDKARRNAKSVNFGLLFLMSVPGFIKYAKLEYGIELSEQQAEAWVQIFFRKYKKLPVYHKAAIEFCRRHGYVESPLGRRRRLPEINSHEKGLRHEAERMAVNHPVQSPSSDTVILAGSELLKEEHDPEEFRPTLFIHDELIWLVKDNSKVEDYARRLKHNMERPPLERDFGVKLRVPLKSDVKVGRNSFEMEKLNI